MRSGPTTPIPASGLAFGLSSHMAVLEAIVPDTLTATLFNGIRLRVYPDCLTSSAAYYFRVPNSLSIKFMRKHIDGGLLLDVGANVGLVSMLLADKIHQAWLFEPNPAAAARACENIRLNALDFEVLQMALSDQKGTVDFENRGGVNAANRTVVGFKTNVPC